MSKIFQAMPSDLQKYKEFSSDSFNFLNEKYFWLCIEYLNDASIPVSAKYVIHNLLFSYEGLKALRYASDKNLNIDEIIAHYYKLTGDSSFLDYFDDIKIFAKQIFISNFCKRLQSKKLSQSNQPSIIFIFGNRGAGKTTFICYALESIVKSVGGLNLPILSLPLEIPSYLIDEMPEILGSFKAIYINLDVFSRLDPIYLATRVFGNYFSMEVFYSRAYALTEYIRSEALRENLNIIDDSARCSENRMKELCFPPKGYRQYNFMIVSNRDTAISQASERVKILGRDNDLEGIIDSALFASQTLLPFVFQKLQQSPTFIFTPTCEANVPYKFKLVASNRLFISYSDYIFVPDIEFINPAKIEIHDCSFLKWLNLDVNFNHN